MPVFQPYALWSTDGFATVGSVVLLFLGFMVLSLVARLKSHSGSMASVSALAVASSVVVGLPLATATATAGVATGLILARRQSIGGTWPVVRSLSLAMLVMSALSAAQRVGVPAEASALVALVCIAWLEWFLVARAASGWPTLAGLEFESNWQRTEGILAAVSACAVLVLVHDEMGLFGLAAVLALLLLVSRSQTLMREVSETAVSTACVVSEIGELGADLADCDERVTISSTARRCASLAGLDRMTADAIALAALIDREWDESNGSLGRPRIPSERYGVSLPEPILRELIGWTRFGAGARSRSDCLPARIVREAVDSVARSRPGCPESIGVAVPSRLANRYLRVAPEEGPREG
jgi:hypothetical protein